MVWRNLPTTSNNTVVETSDGSLYLIYKTADTYSYVYVNKKRTEDYTDSYAAASLLEFSDTSRIYAAASGTDVYLKHRNVIKKFNA